MRGGGSTGTIRDPSIRSSTRGDVCVRSLAGKDPDFASFPVHSPSANSGPSHRQRVDLLTSARGQETPSERPFSPAASGLPKVQSVAHDPDHRSPRKRYHSTKNAIAENRTIAAVSMPGAGTRPAIAPSPRGDVPRSRTLDARCPAVVDCKQWACAYLGRRPDCRFLAVFVAVSGWGTAAPNPRERSPGVEPLRVNYSVRRAKNLTPSADCRRSARGGGPSHRQRAAGAARREIER